MSSEPIKEPAAASSSKPALTRLDEAYLHARKVVQEQQAAVDDGDDFGEHVGLVRHRRATLQGMQIILSIWEDARNG